jgi:hypothetical protein
VIDGARPNALRAVTQSGSAMRSAACLLSARGEIVRGVHRRIVQSCAKVDRVGALQAARAYFGTTKGDNISDDQLPNTARVRS